MSKKIDFTSLPMKDIEGNVFEENVAPFIGNIQLAIEDILFS